MHTLQRIPAYNMLGATGWSLGTSMRCNDKFCHLGKVVLCPLWCSIACKAMPVQVALRVAQEELAAAPSQEVVQQVAYLEGALQQAIGDYESVLAEIVRLRKEMQKTDGEVAACLLYTSPSPRDRTRSRMPSSA